MASANRGFAVESVIVCDDVRTEDNGKAILIGVYSGDVVLPKVPTTLAITLWIKAQSEESGKGLQVRANVFNSATQAVVEIPFPPIDRFEVQAGVDFTVILGRIPLAFASPGYVTFELKFGDRPWSVVLRKNVQVVT